MNVLELLEGMPKNQLVMINLTSGGEPLESGRAAELMESSEYKYCDAIEWYRCAIDTAYIAIVIRSKTASNIHINRQISIGELKDIFNSVFNSLNTNRFNDDYMVKNCFC